jgi:hypothetical protein
MPFAQNFPQFFNLSLVKANLIVQMFRIILYNASIALHLRKLEESCNLVL